MSIENTEHLARTFRRFVDTSIGLDGHRDEETAFCAKLDVLEQLVEMARFQYECGEKTLPLKEALRLRLDHDERQRYLSLEMPLEAKDRSKEKKEKSSYRRRVDYQAPLLVYLLIYPSSRTPLPMTRHLASLLYSKLNIYDFEKTASGSRRYYTHMKFAATSLRGYGLLRSEEKHKRWVLSFTGKMVAAYLHERGDLKRLLTNEGPTPYKGPNHPNIPAMQPTVEEGLNQLRNPLLYGELVNRVLFMEEIATEETVRQFEDDVTDMHDKFEEAARGMLADRKGLKKEDRQEIGSDLTEALESKELVQKLLAHEGTPEERERRPQRIEDASG